MTVAFITSLHAEWLKKKRSLAVRMVFVGGFFTPVIIVIARLVYYERLGGIYSSGKFWLGLWSSAWESVAIFLLPLGSILATSLIAQLEYKNNAWKQVHTLPLGFGAIFFSKLLVIVTLLIQFLLLFNLGIFLAAMIPWLVISGTPFPSEPLPAAFFLTENFFYFVDVLPIVALQYLLSLHFRNFLISIGAGFVLWIGALGALSWKFGYLIPYTYPMYNYLKGGVVSRAAVPAMNIHLLAVGYFLVFTAAGYVVYLTKKEKG